MFAVNNAALIHPAKHCPPTINYSSAIPCNLDIVSANKETADLPPSLPSFALPPSPPERGPPPRFILIFRSAPGVRE